MPLFFRGGGGWISGTFFLFLLTRFSAFPSLPQTSRQPHAEPSPGPTPPLTEPVPLNPAVRTNHPPSLRESAPSPLCTESACSSLCTEPASTLLCTNLLLPLPSASTPSFAPRQPRSTTDPLPCTRALLLRLTVPLLPDISSAPRSCAIMHSCTPCTHYPFVCFLLRYARHPTSSPNQLPADPALITRLCPCCSPILCAAAT
ncbi:hypothetical protein SLEP1_g40230 [Rubroshorea leprosula]|uniref:Uncharacterized protein n=1 Tax=Rubroshorea leprosula TaxID=152421 RepID=A0AAV5L2Z1_9ROSI|nr:hypothetical protein SLEP1_g40230 [Rubroshorea leprosula]